jgi:thiosulfate dehydrogenase
MRFSWSSAVIGVIGIGVLGSLGGWSILQAGYIPINADAPPPAIERQLAMTAVHRTVDRLAPTTTPPVAATDTNITAGAHLYEQNCSICHGASAGRQSTIAAGLYQTPPMFAKHGVDDDPAGETYWKIVHGIRFTGMPAFGSTLSTNDSWKIALFLKNLKALPPHAKTEWDNMKVPGQLIALKTNNAPDQNMDSTDR